MYRYVECGKLDGKTIRTGGETKRSINAIKHVNKLGKVRFVRGYRYKGRHGVCHMGVMVHGENGTVRFGGFAWGYCGEGPRGLNQLFRHLGVNLNAMSHILGDWPAFNGPNQEFWRIDLDNRVLTIKI